MKDNPKESVKQVFEDRIKNPLWGFIILAWLWFNWPNLAMLFMSDAPITFRIDYILSQHYFYFRFIVAPLIAGFFLAIATPYAQWLLAEAHRWAEIKQRGNIFFTKSEDLKETINLSTLTAQSNRAVEVENAKIDADIKAEIERGKREEFATEELKNLRKSLLAELDGLKESIFVCEKEKEKIQDGIIESLLIMSKFFKIDNSQSLNSLKKEIEKLYSTSEINYSTVRNSLRNNRDLTEEQMKTLADLMSELSKKDKKTAGQHSS